MRRNAHSPLRAALLSAGVAAMLLLSSCARFGGSPNPTDNTQISHPVGDELVFRMAHAGGFTPPEFQFTSLPVFSLTGDGRVIVQGAQIDIYPGPMLPALNVRRLTEEGVQKVLQLVADSGQFGASHDWRGAQSFVADASDAVFTLHAQDREVIVTAYALGTFAPDDAPASVPAEEVAAHRALSALMDKLTFPDEWLPAAAWADAAWRPYEASSLQLLVRSADGDPPDDDGIGTNLADWPGPGEPATFGEQTNAFEWRCGVVTGDTTRAWYELMATANQLTRFADGRHTFQVSVRPLLPDEPETCPTL
jgi:hypothetical protein